MKFKELKSIETAKLKEMLPESRKKLQDLRFGIANNQVKKVRELRQLRVNIARINTLLNQQDLNKK